MQFKKKTEYQKQAADIARCWKCLKQLRYHDDVAFSLEYYTTVSPNLEQQHQFCFTSPSSILKVVHIPRLVAFEANIFVMFNTSELQI